MSITHSKCWICGDEPNSREHKIKKSDFKYQSPEVTQTKPIFHRKNGIKKRSIGSLDALALKYPKSICAVCNGSLTQPYDHAWAKLSGFLHTHSQEIESNNSLDIASVYETDLQENIKNIQLFFAKQFGCKLIESEIDFDLSEIGNAILANTEVPALYLKLRRSDNGKSATYCAVSDVAVSKSASSKLEYIHFFYTVGTFSVDILYCTNPDEFDLKDYFLPCTVGKQLSIGRANYTQTYDASKENPNIGKVSRKNDNKHSPYNVGQ